LPPSSLYANKLYHVTVLHSDMLRIQTMHLKIEVFKLTAGPWNLFYEYAGPWHKKGWEPLL